MPIIVAVNGIAEVYPAKLVTPRYNRTEAAADREHHGQQASTLDHPALIAHTAYQQQGSDRSHPTLAVLARDLMTTPVFSLPSDSPLLDAWTIMSHKGFHHIPITSVHGTLVGMLSYRDLLQHVPELISTADTRQASHKHAAEIMTPRVISATPTTEIREIARVMLEEQIHAVPILDQTRRLVGILSTQDLLHGIANHAPLELWT
ncbi:CBS domain-containing protein [Nitrospira sp. CMX1]|nr:CBS domain-containing protein [Nitrospira sp.]MBS0167909.1 CBS domain-containing protein [Nitrospira sp.]